MKRYENAIRTITAFFAVLLGFGLKRLLDSGTSAPSFSPAHALWPCFFLSVLLFLRFLLGSANHMWFEFVRPDRKEGATLAFDKLRVRILNDFAFLVVFGLVGVGICYSETLDQFLRLNLLLAAIGIVWVAVYWLIGKTRGRAAGAASAGRWGYWGWINLIQFAAVLTTQCLVLPANWGTVPWWPRIFPGPPWDIALLLLCVVYLALLAIDVTLQLRNLETDPESP